MKLLIGHFWNIKFCNFFRLMNCHTFFHFFVVNFPSGAWNAYSRPRYPGVKCKFFSCGETHNMDTCHLLASTNYFLHSSVWFTLSWWSHDARGVQVHFTLLWRKMLFFFSRLSRSTQNGLKRINDVIGRDIFLSWDFNIFRNLLDLDIIYQIFHLCVETFFCSFFDSLDRFRMFCNG